MSFELILFSTLLISSLFGVAIFKVAKGSSQFRGFIALLAVITSIVFHFSMALVWILRDGLGPGTGKSMSTGRVAINRFLEDALLALLPTLLLASVLVFFLIKSRKNK